MSWHDRYTPKYWDHERDLRKHDFDPLPAHRFDLHIPTAVEIAAQVKITPNILTCAKMIEAYADARAEQGRLDAVAAGAGA
jgi:hypothetical protein